MLSWLNNPKMPTSLNLPRIGTRWVLEVDDCRKTFAVLKEQDVRFLEPQPREEGWGFAADLLGPDGNRFTIHETRKPSATTYWALTTKKA